MTDATRTLLQMFLDGVRVALVYGVFAALILLLMSNWALPYFSVLKPQIVLVAIFYWTLYRPTLMPLIVVFIVGLLVDLMNPVLPIGTHALSYLLIVGLLRSRRRMLMGQPFMMIWVAFIVAILIDVFVKVSVLQLMTTTSVDMATVLLNILVTTLSFPIVLMVLVFIHRLLPPARGMIAS